MCCSVTTAWREPFVSSDSIYVPENLGLSSTKSKFIYCLRREEMRMQRQLMSITFMFTLLLCAGVGALAQDTPPGTGVRVPASPGADTVFFISSEMSFDGKVVKGAPYSAQAITETTRTLGDGNKIKN